MTPFEWQKLGESLRREHHGQWKFVSARTWAEHSP